MDADEVLARKLQQQVSLSYGSQITIHEPNAPDGPTLTQSLQGSKFNKNLRMDWYNDSIM